MAIYSLRAKMICRSKGQSAIAAAAYRAAERLYDQRLGITFSYTGKRGVVYSEIMLPKNAPAELKNRESLWNKIEASERRKDSQVAREIRIALPVELSLDQQLALVRDYIDANFVSRGIIADINIHHAKEHNPHAHVMLATREYIGGEHGFSPAKDIDSNKKTALFEWRKTWESFANDHLAMAGHDIQITCRSYTDLGINLKAQTKVGVAWHWRNKDNSERYQSHIQVMRENGDRIIKDPGIALTLISRQQSHFTKQDIEKFANKYSVGMDQFNAVCAAIFSHPELARIGEERYTTWDTIHQEERMVKTAKALVKRQRHPVEDRSIYKAIKSRTLTPDQEAALNHVTRSGDLAMVSGYAGAGKSYTLGAVREAYERQGYRVLGASLAGIAADGLERESGIQSRTLARLFFDLEKGRETLSKRDVLVIDEAGMVATRQMARLVEYAHDSGAKLVLVGSSMQFQPIEAGGPFRAFLQRFGSAELSEIRRQKEEWQKEITKRLESGKGVGPAIDKYIQHRRVYSHDTKAQAFEKITEEWKLHRQIGQSSIVIAYKNKDVDELNALIRAKAQEMGFVTSRGKTFDTREAVNDGDDLEKMGNQEIEIKTKRVKRIFAPGDRVLFLKNDSKIDVKNGNFGTIEKIRWSKIWVRLDGDDKRMVKFKPSDYAHIKHGYAATSHKLQGATVDRSIIYADNVCDRHFALVALSRHEIDTSMHYSKETFDTLGRLKWALSRDRSKTLAIDAIEDYTPKRLQEQRRTQAYEELKRMYKEQYRRQFDREYSEDNEEKQSRDRSDDDGFSRGR